MCNVVPIFRPEVVKEGVPPELQSALSQVIAEGRFIKGWEVAAFEKELCLELQTHSVITTGNGTDALLACLMALDLREGDEVITPAYGYPAAVEMMCLRGLKPVLVDVNWQTFNIEAGLLKDAVSSKTKAILPIHLFGLPAPMDDILHFAEQHGLPVIEDAAQCLGAEVEIEGTRRKAGTVGRLGCTSFFPSKNLGCWGDGGAVFVNSDDEQLTQKIRMILNHGQRDKYLHEILGLNSRLDTLQAVVLRHALKYLRDANEKRVEIARRYQEELREISEIKLPPFPHNPLNIPNVFTIKVKPQLRQQLKSFLWEKGISTQIYYPLAMHWQKAYQSRIRSGSSLTNAEKLTHCVLSLPLFPSMEKAEQDRVILALNKYFRNHE